MAMPRSIPFWMLDKKNFSLIISKTVPVTMTDTKNIAYAEVSVPGGDSSDNNYASMGAEEVSFSIKVVNFNNSVGNSPMLSQFRNLRTAGGIFDIAFLNSRQFSANPTVLMWWGTGKFAPMEYKVTEVNFNHMNHNRFGFPQHTDVSMKFRLDQSGVLYKLEDTFSKVASVVGSANGLVKLFSYGNPYKGLF